MGATSIICKKSYAPPVPLAAYWTLDEVAGSADRVDSVSALPLVATGITDGGVPGLIGNGVPFTGAFGGADYDTGAVAQLAHLAANGLSIWGWVRVNQLGGTDAVGGPLFQFLTGGSWIAISVGSVTDPQDCKIKNPTDTDFTALTIGSWHFFVLSWNPLNTKWGWSIDNGGIVYQTTPAALIDDAVGQVQFQQHFNAGTGDVIFDEIGILTTAMITPAQQTYLWNLGAGRTYPITLP